ncbi:hypothetical protein RJ639_044137 [Escallonia herrerae]|uniref:Uncharacterized protein n=1 Tax=Escallonia herrerae TaxID=1293975 RepID=A0AA88WK24_9ASTE|nr:hypothetical protein RJ639_044137 [Escallonia herrerae]
MDQHLGSKFKNLVVSFFLLDTHNVIFLAPACDRMIVRLAKRFASHQGGFTQLHQMGIGLVTSTFAMISAGMLEVVRLKIVRWNNYFDMQKIPTTVLWQVPYYFLLGSAEVFTNHTARAAPLDTREFERGPSSLFPLALGHPQLEKLLCGLGIAEWYTYKKPRVTAEALTEL